MFLLLTYSLGLIEDESDVEQPEMREGMKVALSLPPSSIRGSVMDLGNQWDRNQVNLN
jgi:hypothetical protein